MDDDMRKSLLNKKPAGFDKMYDDCLAKILRIKNKNDFMQKQVGTDVQDSIKQEVVKQKQFIEKQIKSLKLVMDDMQKKFKDPESKNKLKNLKMDAQKQIQRNKIILKDLINKSFIIKSRGSNHSDDDVNQYIQGGQVNYKHLGNERRKNKDQQSNYNVAKFNKDESLITDNNVQMDFQIQRKILLQKKNLLDQVEQTTLRVNDIMNDMAVMIDEQGENLQIISQQMMKTNKNLVQTNKQLEEASKLQKKSRKKYFLFALLFIILIAGLIGVFTILS